ncbi:SURF1 family cytochrome oxidase biogenesis protein [Bradyrhizobium sp. ARR65]|uniref:SURF1 family protein n=1 Tax=Bradyrhizobium sp. ARR65 TaxID=1040989 RepID=UPI0004637E8F|nr:SURF1 family cytochrome oxidase biogenesis protein [Bradyrhizobium sp. ARR65]
MTDTVRQHGSRRVAMLTIAMAALFMGLGIWQLQRRIEERTLVEALGERLRTASVPLPDPSQWHSLSAASDEFRRVNFSTTYEPRLDAMVYSSASPERTDISGPGTWAFIPGRLPTGEIVAINAGFVPNARLDRDQQDPAMAQLITYKPVVMTGYIRFPEPAGALTPNLENDKRLWFSRDHLAMAQALGWGEVAPFYIDLETPVPASGVPKPGPLHVYFVDHHLQYAIIWFSLTFLALTALAVSLRDWLLRRPL